MLLSSLFNPPPHHLVADTYLGLTICQAQTEAPKSIDSFKPHNNPLRWVVRFTPNSHSERQGNLCKVTEPVPLLSGSIARVPTQCARCFLECIWNARWNQPPLHLCKHIKRPSPCFFPERHSPDMLHTVDPDHRLPALPGGSLRLFRAAEPCPEILSLGPAWAHRR